MKKLWLFLILVLAVLPFVSWAMDVGISAFVQVPAPPTPGDTVVIFKGLAYPNSQVTIERQGTILVTVPADPKARFDVTIDKQLAGIWTYAVYAEDASGVQGRPSNFTLSITQNTTTTVSGIFLGPTIGADKASLRLSDTVTMLGVTAPSSTVTIYVSSEEEFTFQTKAGADGLWSRQILGSDIGVADHNVRAKSVTTANEISAFSDTISFTVKEDEADVCDGKNRADLNCDDKVDLVDFSILLFYWRQRNPTNVRADINADGIVDLIDFSILLFNWTG